MSSMRTATVAPDGGVRTGGSGMRNDTNLRAMFRSPLYAEYTTTVVSDLGVSALNGNGGPGDSQPNIGIVNGEINDSSAYYGFSPPVNLNFVGAPSYDEVQADIDDTSKFTEGGRPSSPWVPNLASPGPGSTYPSDQPTYTGAVPARNDNYGVGLGSSVSPQETSGETSAQRIGSFLSGKSSLLSIGAYSG